MRDPKYFETYYNLKPGQWDKQVIRPTSSTALESSSYEIACVEAENANDIVGSIAVAEHALKPGGLLILGVAIEPDGYWNLANEAKGFRPLFISHLEKIGTIRQSIIKGVPYNHLAKEKKPGVVVAKLQKA